MWSVWNRPNPGSRRMSAPTSSLANDVLRASVNSRGPSVIRQLYNRPLASFRLHEWGLDHLALDGAAPDVDGDGLAVLDSGVRVDHGQRNTDFQCRRERSRCGDADGLVPGEHGQVGPQHTAAGDPQTTQQPPRARCLLGDQGVAPPEGGLFPA